MKYITNIFQAPNLPISRLLLNAFAPTYQIGIKRIAREQVAVAYEEELLAGAGDGDIEFSIDLGSAHLLTHGEDVQLIGARNGGGEDDVVALRTLVALYGVDGYGVDIRYTSRAQTCTHHADLVAEGHDDAQLLGQVEGRLAAQV